MWIIRWTFVVIIMILLLVFVFQNNKMLSDEILIDFFNMTYSTSVMVLVLISLITGIVIWLAVSIFQMLNIRMELRGTRKEIAQLKTELSSLRNLELEDEDGEESTKTD